jgi:hypothetical protein
MPTRQAGILAKRASTWLRDHFWRSTMLPRPSKPTTWNEFLHAEAEAKARCQGEDLHRSKRLDPHDLGRQAAAGVDPQQEGIRVEADSPVTGDDFARLGRSGLRAPASVDQQPLRVRTAPGLVAVRISLLFSVPLPCRASGIATGERSPIGSTSRCR